MAGVLVPISTRKQWDFSFLKPDQSREIVLVKDMPAIRFGAAKLCVRVHHADLASGAFEIAVFNTYPQRSEAVEFTGAESIMGVRIDAQVSPPALLSQSVHEVGPFLKVVLRATQGKSRGTLCAELSGGMILRSS